ncbi:nuclear transport factor 2 family protein [Methylobacterium sp. J-030]|uniref:nuclear transport factor 2 family protein n=1 Tax=Methylobacterium sp. J-030 TaxID=2836627 RepID=UPI001FBB54D5|nr:nuclear transport factor 2 family protein [Methylobacterium sp. J-030]MCJ2073998.1 nuclear transport factor 2 family protein [Methylobacterium sp. J-030]
MPGRPDASPAAAASVLPAGADDPVAISDAPLRFAAGVDAGEADLIGSAFAEEATVDSAPCGRMLGLDFPPLEGREAIVGFLSATARTRITTPGVTNLRAHRVGEMATLTALVTATHMLRDAPNRRFCMMSRYAADLVRDSERWRMRRMVIAGAWSDGEAGVLLAR